MTQTHAAVDHVAPGPVPAGWLARLALNYRLAPGPDGAASASASATSGARTLADFRHDGPVRILHSLYPEGPGVCHNVLIHPPGGLVGGDRIDINVTVATGAHGLLTTPGATRYYRSNGAEAVQNVLAHVASGARLEWLPLETLAYDGCIGVNQTVFDLDPGAELMVWDLLALGLPASGQPFAHGRITQHLEVRGHWLDRGVLRADDTRLMDGPLGLAGQRCVATLALACGSPWARARREQALDAARAVIDAQATGQGCLAGATAPNDHVVLVRALAPMVEPAFVLLRQVRAAWRQALWGLDEHRPRLWSL